MEKVIIRRAQANDRDARLIARCVMMGVGYELDSLTAERRDDLAELTRLVLRTDTLYSYRNTFVAELNGLAVGAMIAYPGAGYRQMRAASFPRLSFFRGQDIEAMPVETLDGEFYFDTLAVLPPYRGRGIARRLFTYAIAHKPGNLVGTLLVNPANPPALRLYRSLGFRHDGQVFAFNMLYDRMVLNA